MSINISNIHFSYDKKHDVLKNLSLRVDDGDIIALMGLSGSGKTTLLRILLGLEELTSGEIEINGIAYNEKNILEIRNLISYIPQHGALYPHLTCLSNILLPLKVGKRLDENSRSRVNELADLCNLNQRLLVKYPSELSGGQKQRVSTIRALITDHQYIFMDEALSALDPITKVKMQKELKQIFKIKNKTVIMVSHSLQEVKFICDKAAILRNGKLEQYSTISDLFTEPKTKFVSDFVLAQS